MATYKVGSTQDVNTIYHQIKNDTAKLVESVETSICDVIDRRYFKYLELMRDTIMQEVDKGLSPDALTIGGEALINQKAAKIIQDIEDSVERNKNIKDQIRQQAGKYEVTHLQALVDAIDDKIIDLLEYNPDQNENNLADRLRELKAEIQEEISSISN